MASDRLARLLVHVGCGSADRVCLLSEKSPAVIVGMLATLKAGCRIRANRHGQSASACGAHRPLSRARGGACWDPR